MVGLSYLILKAFENVIVSIVNTVSKMFEYLIGKFNL